jgi:hypothetical protein
MPKNEVLPLEQAWSLWIDCLKGEDPNWIFRQIYRMIWDAAIFRLVWQSRQITLQSHPLSPPINPHFHSFLDTNFFTSQAASIRRLADKSRYGLHGEKGIFSLYALVEDISARRLELTREEFFRLRKLPYHYRNIQEKQKEYIFDQIRKGATGFWIPPELDHEPIAEAHATFDRLCGNIPHDRTPQDIISEKVFIRLNEKLSTTKYVTDYVDKFIAHSATPESRLKYNVVDELTLKHIWDAHKTLYVVAEFLSGILYSEDQIPLAWEPSNLFIYWDAPLIDSDDLSQLVSVFERYRQETDKWRLEGVDELWQWIESG